MILSKGGTYINGKNAREGQIVTFVDEGEIITSDRFKYEDGNPVKSLVFKVKIDGEEKLIKITNQSKIGLIEAWGEETRNWIGKKATIFVFPTPDGSNKTIVLKPLNGTSTPLTSQQQSSQWEP